MDFSDQIEGLAKKAQRMEAHLLQTEEATKMALIVPFIHALGYNVYDPEEVVPEFTADVGEKKGEKVDYAIMKDRKPIVLFECKPFGTDLNKEQATQLFRYFHATEAKFAVLTNGSLYRLYTDLEEPNKMDKKPFMEFDLLSIQKPLVAELKKLTKSAFNLDEMLTAAEELKYAKEIKRVLTEQITNPSVAFVKFFFDAQVFPGQKTKAKIKQFTDTIRNAFNQFIDERINDRLESAKAKESASVTEEISEEVEELRQDKSKLRIITTTEEELEGFFIVKTILREAIDPNRISHKDTLNYFVVLLDNKTVCRLHFNSAQKYIALTDDDKKYEKIPIENLEDIYKFSDRLKAIVTCYDKEKS